MTILKPAGLVTACVLASVAAAREPDTLTLDQALALARERSPVLQAARFERDIALGATRGAGAPPNPVFDAGLGTHSTVTSPELQLGVSQSLPLAELGPSRSGTIAHAAAIG